MLPKPPRLVTLRVNDVTRFVDGSVNADALTHIVIEKIPATSWWMIGFMPAVGELVRCTDGSWMTRPPQSCPRGHLLRPGAMLVGTSRAARVVVGTQPGCMGRR
jgi:hypothetical protein